MESLRLIRYTVLMYMYMQVENLVVDILLLYFNFFKQLWFNNNCLETSTLNTGIENINSVVDTWKNSLGTNCR